MENSSKNKSENNVLNMYVHLDWCYRPAKASSLYISWLLFKRIFKLAFNGFAKPDGEKIEGTLIEKILAVGYVLFTLLGCLSLLVALCALANAGLGPLFFICLGIGSSLLGIVAIGTIIFSAIHRKTMRKTEIYVYSKIINNQQNVLFARESAKFFMEQKEYQAFNITKNINTENLVIPMSNVYSQKDFLSNSK